MDKINVDTVALAADLNNLSESLTAIRESLDKMDDSIFTESLRWEGKAADNFTKSYRGTSLDTWKIYTVLKKDYDNMERICRAYETCEHEVSDQLNSVGW